MVDPSLLSLAYAQFHPVLPTTIRALFSTVSPLSSHEVDGVRKEKERLTDGRSPRGEYEVNVDW